ncbi:MAG: NADH:ubiquinone oxidoreductase [Deltaproteobacteria bacterium]|jgi:hydrogenase small subunit|nr:NADH:ubiquinone oxidoreductase [Deltaproteobacteria bacterium]
MSLKLLWIQCGGCGGDTWSFFNSESPNVTELFGSLDIDLLWHPSISTNSPNTLKAINEDLMSGVRELDVLCVEGSILRGPGGTGLYDEILGKPKKDLVASLANRARHILAIGTCASYGGIGANTEIEATGMQFLREEKGGFLGEEFTSGSGMPVINLPGCPCHSDVVVGTLVTIGSGAQLELDEYNTPVEWYGMMVHQGCTRNEYHEYRVEERKFGEKGCMFFHLGCHGPLVRGPCNKMLWNDRSSKTRVGVPCFGCTRPDFPQQYPFFQTRNIEGIPIELPEGISRAHYMAYKGMAAAAAPKRLKTRKTGI